MRVRVLGETSVERDHEPLELTSRKLRQIIATLAMAGGRPVSYDALVDMLWGDEPPEALPGTLHAYIAALRRTLEPDRAPRAPARVLVTVGAGYALRTDDDALDAIRFQRSVSDVDRRLGRSGLVTRPELRTEELTAIATELDDALALWRGEAYADLGDADAVRAERGRLDELRTVALEDRATVRLALGAHAPVAAELEALTGTYPMRERLWALRALALVHGGRQADALEVLRELADLLDDGARAGALGGAARPPGADPASGPCALVGTERRHVTVPDQRCRRPGEPTVTPGLADGGPGRRAGPARRGAPGCGLRHADLRDVERRAGDRQVAAGR